MGLDAPVFVIEPGLEVAVKCETAFPPVAPAVKLTVASCEAEEVTAPIVGA
jgi:hypothetical protein